MTGLFQSEGVRVIQTPMLALNANTYAELPFAWPEQSLRVISARPVPGVILSSPSRRTNSPRTRQDSPHNRSRWADYPGCSCSVFVPRRPFRPRTTWMKFLHLTGRFSTTEDQFASFPDPTNPLLVGSGCSHPSPCCPGDRLVSIGIRPPQILNLRAPQQVRR
jgi:hypothetical protein